MYRRPLLCHVATPSAIPKQLEVAAGFTAAGELQLSYSLHAPLEQLRIPAWLFPQRADGLWQHTCFEAFMRAGGGPNYREFNFSPSGQWQAYDFSAYRQAGACARVAAPTVFRQEDPGGLELTCILPGDALPGGRQLHLGLTAVIEAADGSVSYWSLRHPPGRPDFHHTHGFALTLYRP